MKHTTIILAISIFATACSKGGDSASPSSSTPSISSAFPDLPTSQFKGPKQSIGGAYTASVFRDGSINIQVDAPPIEMFGWGRIAISGASQSTATGFYYPINVYGGKNSDSLVSTGKLGKYSGSGKSYYELDIAANIVFKPGAYVDTL